MHTTTQQKHSRQPAKTLSHLYQRLRGVVSLNSASRVAVEPATRVAVLGLYRSGSSAVAGVLDHLGVNMGPPFFHNLYESAWLSQQLRLWWNEPEISEKTSAPKRIQILKRWIKNQERTGSKWVGMKHPLLSLCGPDLLKAWGPSVRFIWAWRPLDNSTKSLIGLNWFSSAKSEQCQQTLWAAMNKFSADHEHLRIDFAHMMADPRLQVMRLVDYLGLAPTEEQIADATAYIQPHSKE